MTLRRTIGDFPPRSSGVKGHSALRISSSLRSPWSNCAAKFGEAERKVSLCVITVSIERIEGAMPNGKRV